MGSATFITRALPFVLLRNHGHHPMLGYLGRLLPPMLMVILLVYSFKNEAFLSIGFLPEFLSVGITAVLHLAIRQPLISIVAGTASYMAFVQLDLLAMLGG